MQTIKKGSSCQDVQIAQYLTEYCVTVGKASIEFTDAFHDYVKNWQKNHKLTVDGIIGSNTWISIASNAPVCSTSKGSKAAICALQTILGVTVDGIFGQKTKAAVVSYQAARGLSADGIVGIKTWTAMIHGAMQITTTETHDFKQPVDYKQGDSRWGKIVYTSVGNKNQTIANSGCGPTAMANIVATMKNSSITPPDLAKLSCQWGCRTASSGTAWAFYKKIADHFGFSKFVQTSSLETLKSCLSTGGYAVCSMGKGFWTKGGHFITAWKYDSKYIYCNDPASSVRKKQEISQFIKERKQFFCFWK